jgi:hypothetical protein
MGGSAVKQDVENYKAIDPQLSARMLPPLAGPEIEEVTQEGKG